MKTTSLTFNPAFKFNGLHYETKEELMNFALELIAEGEDYEVSIGKFIRKWFNDKKKISVKTSGSTGKPKKIKLSKKAMAHSALATGSYFKVGHGTSALLCLPTRYIAGKMMLVRAIVLGWDLHVVAPEKDALTQYDNDYDFVAMVPYQVAHSLAALPKVKKLIIGGGDISEELEKRLQEVPTEVFATYGMTETVTHIAVRRVNGAGRTDEYSSLPNVKLSVDSRNCLVIDAPNIAEDVIVTNDLVELISPSRFKWLGRIDNVINSGGVKIYPEKVERILASYIDLPFVIASEKDETLGERVILVIENKATTIPNYSEAFKELEKYQRPKKVYTMSAFPYTKTGKIKRSDVLQVMGKYK